MKLNEYLTENGVKLMIKGSGENYPPRQTNDLGMYDYAEGLENVIGKMAWIPSKSATFLASLTLSMLRST